MVGAFLMPKFRKGGAYGRVHNPGSVLPVSVYLDIPLSCPLRYAFSLSRSTTILLFPQVVL